MIMSVLDDLQAKADLNGDGKLSMEDLQTAKDKLTPEQWEKLKEIGDRNGDGKVDIAHLLDFNCGDTANDITAGLGSIFGGK